MDTPGGLDLSMRAIIQDILASPVPVASFVAPGGARAASAGTYVLYASHVAAMAPGTNLGAATPVQIASPSPMPGKDEGKQDAGKASAAAPPADAHERKAVHDAAAYIRGLALLRGRNAEWAERAVREAVSLTAPEALDAKVIDLVARDVPDLLKRLDGRKLTAAGTERTLATAAAPVDEQPAGWRTEFLATITDPAYRVRADPGGHLRDLLRVLESGLGPARRGGRDLPGGGALWPADDAGQLRGAPPHRAGAGVHDRRGILSPRTARSASAGWSRS